jgi:5'-nucleotidase
MAYLRLMFCCFLGLAAAFGVDARQSEGRCAPCPIRVTLLHLNDVSQFAPVERGARGGLARVSTLRKQVMSESPNTLFLFGGNTIAPSAESITYQGAQMIDAWNQAGLDYSVFGIREFDYGPDVLLERVRESRFTWLGANVVDSKTGKRFADTPPFVVRELQSVKVGIFGLLTPDAKKTSRADGVEIGDPFQAAARVVKELQAQGVRVIIAVTHLTPAQDQELARRLKGIDVIIGGNARVLTRSVSGATPIFKTSAEARDISRIDLLIDPESGRLESIDGTVIPVTSNVAEDPQFASLYMKYATADQPNPIGRTEVALDATREANNNRETNIGSFIADAFRRRMQADMAFVNAGSIEANRVIPPGALTERDVRSLQPNRYEVTRIKITGANVLRALEHSVSEVGASPSGRFLQVSGLRFTFDASRPPGSRVVSVNVGGKPLSKVKTYTLAINSFLRAGGAGYQMFRGLLGLGMDSDPRSLADGGEEVGVLKGGALNLKAAWTPIGRPPTDYEILLNSIQSTGVIAPKADGRIQPLLPARLSIKGQKSS